MKIIKGIALAAISAVAITALAGCNMNMTAPMIVRKMGDDTVWVKDIKDSTETVKAYRVKSDYYNSTDSNPGQVFDTQYAIGDGVTEYEYSW